MINNFTILKQERKGDPSVQGHVTVSQVTIKRSSMLQT